MTLQAAVSECSPQVADFLTHFQGTFSKYSPNVSPNIDSTTF